ncbi:MAG: hypothetical protein AAF902_25215 [Chloroflexota bacterium]
MDLIGRLSALEEPIAYRKPPPVGQLPFKVTTGIRPILLSAPHSTRHSRNGKHKMEEEFTAGLARLLAEETGCHAIYNQWETADDPNWDQQAVYKKHLAKLVERQDIKLVIDLHGMTNRHKIGVALGTINGRACPDYERPLQQAFLAAGFEDIPVGELLTLTTSSWGRLVVNHPKFTGGIKSHTITRFASQTLGVQAVQVEITSSARIVHRGPHDGWPFHFYGEPNAIYATISALSQFLEKV